MKVKYHVYFTGFKLSLQGFLCALFREYPTTQLLTYVVYILVGVSKLRKYLPRQPLKVFLAGWVPSA